METSVVVTDKPAKHKKTMRNLLIGFIVIMALLTFFSKTINNISLAKVSVASPFSAALQKTVSASGKFESRGNTTVSAEISCRVESVPVSAGDTVSAGETLVNLELDYLADQLSAAQDELAKMKNNRSKAALGYTAQDYTQMEVAVDVAKDNRDKAQADYDAVKAAFDAGTADQSHLDAAAQALRAAQDDYDIKKSQLSHAKSVDSKQKKASKLDLENMDIDIAAQQQKIDDIQVVIDGDGKIVSPIDGIVQKIDAQEGAILSPAQPVAELADTSEGMTFAADVTNDDADLMPLEAETDIELNGGTDIVHAVLTEKKDSAAQPGEMTTLYFDISPAGTASLNIQPNQAGDLSYTQKTQGYETTVPNDAVREDSTSKFVLVVSENDTPLGKQEVLRRIDVIVLDSDAFRTAISGALSPGSEVVTGSDKPVSDGDTVRRAS